jgi:hypothetical protein
MTGSALGHRSGGMARGAAIRDPASPGARCGLSRGAARAMTRAVTLSYRIH